MLHRIWENWLTVGTSLTKYHHAKLYIIKKKSKVLLFTYSEVVRYRLILHAQSEDGFMIWPDNMIQTVRLQLNITTYL